MQLQRKIACTFGELEKKRSAKKDKVRKERNLSERERERERCGQRVNREVKKKEEKIE